MDAGLPDELVEQGRRRARVGGEEHRPQPLPDLADLLDVRRAQASGDDLVIGYEPLQITDAGEGFAVVDTGVEGVHQVDGGGDRRILVMGEIHLTPYRSGR